MRTRRPEHGGRENSSEEKSKKEGSDQRQQRASKTREGKRSAVPERDSRGGGGCGAPMQKCSNSYSYLPLSTVIAT